MTRRRIRTTRLTGITLVLGLTLSVLHGADAPDGEVLSPALGELSVPPDRNQPITFRGWVNFSGAIGRVEVDVLTRGNGNSNDQSLWRRFTDIIPGTIATVVNGQQRYEWTFTGSAATIFPGEAWPDGGTARVRFRAKRNDQGGNGVYLRVRDGVGVFGNTRDLVLSDIHPTPAHLPKSESPNYLDRKPTLSREETQRYYLSVGTGPDGGGQPLSTIPTLWSFKQRYFPPGTTEFVATYFNNGDLGLGREMHCMRNAEQESACYVKNYGTVGGSLEAARASLVAGQPFATVVMVERGRMRAGEANKVFFAVYDNQRLLNPANPDSAPLAYEAPLDTKGHNKSIPGNCLVCHGAASQYTPSSPPSFNAKVTGAYFLPFDLQSFFFFSYSPSDRLSRAAQEDVFKQLNRLVQATSLKDNSAADELIKGWYGGPTWPSKTFIGGFVPSGWRNAADSIDDANRVQLYRNVVARSCRTCHVSHGAGSASDLTFGTYDQFNTRKLQAYLSVCFLHGMPNAEQALKGFWSSSARSHFLDRLGLPEGCGVRRPGAMTAAGQALSASAIDVRDVVQRYTVDSCACTTRDCLANLDDHYLGELANATPSGRDSEEVLAALFDEAAACRARVFGPGGAAGAVTPSASDSVQR